MFQAWTYKPTDVNEFTQVIENYKLKELEEKESKLTHELQKIQNKKTKLFDQLHPFHPFLSNERYKPLLYHIISYLPVRDALLGFGICNSGTNALVNENWRYRTESEFGRLIGPSAPSESDLGKHDDDGVVGMDWELFYQCFYRNERIAQRMKQIVCPWCFAKWMKKHGSMMDQSVWSTGSSVPWKTSWLMQSFLSDQTSIDQTGIDSMESLKEMESLKHLYSNPGFEMSENGFLSCKSCHRPITNQCLDLPPRNKRKKSPKKKKRKDKKVRMLYPENRQLYVSKKPFSSEKNQIQHFANKRRRNHVYCYTCAVRERQFSPDGFYATKVYPIVDFICGEKNLYVRDAKFGVCCASCIKNSL